MIEKGIVSIGILNSLKILAIANVIGAIYLFLWPRAWTDKISKTMKMWISTRQMTRFLDVMIDVDSGIMKLRKILGIAALTAAIALFYLYYKYKAV